MFHIGNRPSRRRCRPFSGSPSGDISTMGSSSLRDPGLGELPGDAVGGLLLSPVPKELSQLGRQRYTYTAVPGLRRRTRRAQTPLPGHRRPALAVGATLSDAGAGRSWRRRRGGGGAGGAESGLAEQRDAAVPGLGADGSGRVLLGARGCRRWGRTAGAAGVPGRARICPSSFYSTSCITLCSA